MFAASKALKLLLFMARGRESTNQIIKLMVWRSEAQDEKKLKYRLVALAVRWIYYFCIIPMSCLYRISLAASVPRMYYHTTMTEYRLNRSGLSLGILWAVADRHGDHPEDRPEEETDCV